MNQSNRWNERSVTCSRDQAKVGGGKQGTSSVVGELPRIDKWLVDGFTRVFLPNYLRKHFHCVALQRDSLVKDVFANDAAVVLYANHASWWDPMIAMLVRRHLMPEHRLYAPIDAQALARYRIFRRMGFYGIEAQSRRGAAEFLRQSLRIAREPMTTIALTPEGRFCDVRDRGQPLMPGLAHLAWSIESTPSNGSDQAENRTQARLDSPRDGSSCVWFVPAAIEYVFWEERLPECLCWFGEPVRVAWAAGTKDKPAWQAELTSRLRTAQAALAGASVARDASQFEILLRGRAGAWRPYDALRRLRARLVGSRVPLQHGEKFSSPS